MRSLESKIDIVDKTEVDELLKITVMMSRAADSLENCNSLSGNKEKNKLAAELYDGREVIYAIIRNEKQRNELIPVINIVGQAKATISKYNVCLENVAGTDLEEDVRIAYLNLYKVMNGNKEYNKYP